MGRSFGKRGINEMKKKRTFSSIINALILITVSVTALSCSRGGNESYRMIEHGSISEAEKSAGFEFGIYEWDDWKIDGIKSVRGKLIQADITSGDKKFTVKKCRSRNRLMMENQDEYENRMDLNKFSSAKDFTMLGKDGKTRFMIWTLKKFSYCLSFEDGMENETAVPLAMKMISTSLSYSKSIRELTDEAEKKLEAINMTTESNGAEK